MAVVTLAEAKAHLRVTDTSEDSNIQLYINAATDFIEKYIQRDSIPGGSASIKAAGLLLIGDLFANREAQIVGTIVTQNKQVINLLAPYREKMGV